MSNKENPSFYDRLRAEDVVTWALPLLTRAGYRVRPGDGHFIVETSIHPDAPWHHVKHSDQLDCHLYHAVMFDVLFKNMEVKWVASDCQGCWKVVVRPKTLLGLFALDEIQKRLGRPSKCGIEVRETVHGLYGGYFYNLSLEAGRECYELVRKAVDEEPLLGPDVTVLLKRGCTEFEMECGPSNEWKVTPEQERAERLIKKTFVSDHNFTPQPDHVVTRVFRRWIEFAYAAGDETYKHFTNGEPLYPPYVTYHDTGDNPPAEQAEQPAPKPPAAKPASGRKKSKK